MWWVCLAAAALASDVTLTPEAQVRPRLEVDTGRDGDAATPAGVFVSQRTRLGGVLAAGALEAHVVVQDVRVWGEEEHTLFDYSAGALDVHEANLAWIEEAWSVRVGRQEVNLHEHRLVGNVGWTQQARAFDGVRGAVSAEGWGADLLVAALSDDRAAAFDDDAALIVLKGGRSDDAGLVADLVYVGELDGNRDLSRHTTGVYAKSPNGPFSGRIEGYLQLGDQGGDSIRAFMLGARATWAPDVRGKPSVTLWYDFLSGDDEPDDVQSAFNTLYATNHKFYGLIDIAAFSLGGPADGSGLEDLALKLSASPAKGVGVNLDGHLFMAAASGDGDMLLGQEIDLTGGWKVSKHLELSAGGALFVAPERDPDGWAFAMVDAHL